MHACICLYLHTYSLSAQVYLCLTFSFYSFSLSSLSRSLRSFSPFFYLALFSPLYSYVFALLITFSLCRRSNKSRGGRKEEERKMEREREGEGERI